MEFPVLSGAFRLLEWFMVFLLTRGGRPHITVLIPNITAPIKQQWGGRITTPCIMAPQYNGPSYGHITTPLYTGSTHLQEGSAWRLQWVGISRWSNIKIYEHTCVWPVTGIREESDLRSVSPSRAEAAPGSWNTSWLATLARAESKEVFT